MGKLQFMKNELGVHLMNPYGSGEFTFCGRAWDDYDKEAGFQEMEECEGPMTCPECKRIVKGLKKYLNLL